MAKPSGEVVNQILTLRARALAGRRAPARPRAVDLAAPGAAAWPRVLMLQGPPSAFWAELGATFRTAGCPVRKLNLCLADQLFWRGGGSRAYRGTLAAWPRWLAGYLRAEGISDILYYADQLPYHRAAAEVARRAGIRAWAVEFGYLRPDWLTFEPVGMGRFSRFTRDPGEIRYLAATAPEVDLTPRFGHSFPREAASEVVFNLAMVAGRPLFPRYESDKYDHPVPDYLSWLPRLARGRVRARAAALLSQRYTAWDGPRFLVPLQIQGDYQLRRSTDFREQGEMIERIIASFARRAGGAARLLFKLHPLDNGRARWGRRVGEIARAYSVEDVVDTIDGGDLSELIAASSGMITANSTSGLHALRAGLPVITLGDAVYDVPGLTHQGGLARFWTAPMAPDPQLVAQYCRALATEIQVRGSFYDPAGRRAAAAEIVARVTRPGRFWRHYRAVD